LFIFKFRLHNRFRTWFITLGYFNIVEIYYYLTAPIIVYSIIIATDSVKSLWSFRISFRKDICVNSPSIWGGIVHTSEAPNFGLLCLLRLQIHSIHNCFLAFFFLRYLSWVSGLLRKNFSHWVLRLEYRLFIGRVIY
jgi:hypothetical protein